MNRSLFKMPEAPSVSGYSFYLNVVVVSSNVGKDDEEGGGEMNMNDMAPPLTDENANAVGEDPSSSSSTSNGGSTDVVDKQKNDKSKLLLDGRAFVDSIGAGLAKRAAAFVTEEKTKRDPMKFVQGSANVMNTIGGQIGKNMKKVGTAVSRGAKTFVANKTIVMRAEKAVTECITLVTEEIGVEMSISKRFQQGPVFVLEVDMKGCDLLMLLEKVLGEEKALNYRNAREGIIELGLERSLREFDQEILPQVRSGLMNKMALVVPEKMRMKKSNADLEIECIPLNDDEEAKWLYSFLEFTQQMK